MNVFLKFLINAFLPMVTKVCKRLLKLWIFCFLQPHLVPRRSVLSNMMNKNDVKVDIFSLTDRATIRNTVYLKKPDR